MSAGADEGAVLVLSSRRAFEAFAGVVPPARRSGYRFVKPRGSARVSAALDDARLVITQSYTRPELNRWVLEARHRGIPTLLLVDGPLEWSNVHANPSLRRPGNEAARGLFAPVIHDAVAAIGPAQARFIESRNDGREIVTVCYSNQRIRTTMQQNREPDYDFLVTTARTAAFSDLERRALARALSDTCVALAAAGHRSLVRIFDERLRAEISARAPQLDYGTDGSFTETLARCRCVIGTPSSVLLEAMVHGRPTATLAFRDSPPFYSTGWLIGGFGDWNATFASMLARDPERMALQADSLRENLAEQDLYSALDALAQGDRLRTPRPIDPLDVEFENRVLRRIAGWRGRLFAPLFRRIHLRRIHRLRRG